MRYFAAVITLLLISSCQSTYYDAMESLGIHKRDILIDRIVDAQQAQQEGQEQFRSTLDQFKAVTNFQGGDLEEIYNLLNSEYEDSVSAAESINSKIEAVESVANALFDEWSGELEQYTSQNLRRDSERQLKDTQRRYQRLLTAMRNAERTIVPVLNNLRDNVLFLKHNLNARAITSLKNELAGINTDVTKLLDAMQKAINESDQFIKAMRDNQ